MAKFNIKKGDNVLVLTGKDNGKTGTVLECLPEQNKVIVRNVNIIVKHNKPKSAQEKGGITKKEGAFDASNVMVICPTCGKATRVAHGKDENGKSYRVCKHCNANLDDVKKPAKKTATKADAKASVKEEKPVEKKAAEKKTTTKTTAKKTTTATKTKVATTAAKAKTTTAVRKTGSK